jgi:regulator of replication initiation timing
MADEEVARSIQDALNRIVNTTDQSGNMRKELKKAIYENVSTLRNLFVKLHEALKERSEPKEQTDKETQTREAEIEAGRRDKYNNYTDRRPETPREQERAPLGRSVRQVLPPMLYSEAAAGRREKEIQTLSQDKVHPHPRGNKENTEVDSKPNGNQRGHIGTQNFKGRQNTNRSREQERNRDTRGKDAGRN